MQFDHASNYPPLISPRSPSYERASQEFLHPTAGADPQLVASLAQLSEAEQNAGLVCARVADHVQGARLAEQVREHANTHEARRASLGDLVESLGGSAPRTDECREILTRSLDTAARVNSDNDAKLALTVMRRELSDVYEEVLQSTYLQDAQRAALRELAPSAQRLR